MRSMFLSLLLYGIGIALTHAGAFEPEVRSLLSKSDKKGGKEKQLRKLLTSRRGGVLTGIFEADALPLFSNVDWFEWMDTHMESLVQKNTRYVERSDKGWAKSVADIPLLGAAVGCRDISTGLFKEGCNVETPPVHNVCFGTASKSKRIKSVSALREAYERPEAIVVIELKQIAKVAGGSVRTNKKDKKTSDPKTLAAQAALVDVRAALTSLQKVGKRKPVDADLYTAQPGIGSYGWHQDEVDNLVLCVHGNKRFRIAGMKAGSPVEVDTILYPGDAVYVPAGFFHHGLGGDEQSIIWSIGFRSEVNESEWLKDFTADEELRTMQCGGDYFGEPMDEDKVSQLVVALQRLQAEEDAAEEHEEREL